jgi:hypothetical protein
MKDYLTLWNQELLKLKSFTMKSKLTVTGERNQHLGPRWDFAKVRISVEPASQFEVIDAAVQDEEAQKARYVDWTIFGLLDVLLVTESAPLKNVRVTIENIESHPINSSQIAFRLAGRDAGRKVLESLRSTIY